MKYLITLLVSFSLLACNETTEVKWPTLTELDNLSIAVEKAAYQHKHEKQKELLLEAKAKMNEVLSSLPANAQNTDKVNILLKDLEALSGKIVNLDTMKDNDLDTLSRGIHPIVSRLMETSGVPHVHGEACTHDASTCSDPSHHH